MEKKHYSKKELFIRKMTSKTAILTGVILSFFCTSLLVYAFGVGTRIIFSPGTTISSTDVNSNFEKIYALLNTGALVGSTNTAYTVSCTGSMCSSTDDVPGTLFDSITYDGNGLFLNDVFTVADGGVYKVEILSFPTASQSGGDCTTVMFNLAIKINSEYTGSSTAVKELTAGDAITFYTELSSTDSTTGCTASADFSSTKVLIRKIF